MSAKRTPAASRKGASKPFDFRPAWQLDDPSIGRDAIAFWNRVGILPPGVRPEDRVGELVAVAYRNRAVIGVATAQLTHIKTLHGRFAAYRCAVDPAHRRQGLALALTIYARDLLEQWSLEHPEEKVLGLAAVVENPDLAVRLREPVWPTLRLNLAHFLPDGRQLRVAWFAHARVE